jgi:small-conductance mechanosensitive channel
MSRLSGFLYASLLLTMLVSIGCLGADAPPPAATPPVTLPLPPEQVVRHVSRTITWYRGVAALQQLPVDSDDVLPRDRLYHSALTSLKLAFDFGRAAGTLAGKPQPTSNQATANAGAPDSPDDNSQGTAVDRAAARMADRISRLQSQLSSIDDQIAHVAPKDKSTLTAKRAEVSAALDLAKEIQATVGQIQHFEEASDVHASGSSGALAAQIADLQRSVPETRSTETAPRGGNTSTAAPPGAGSSPTTAATPAPASTNTETFRPESAGIITLLGKWFSLLGTRRQLADVSKQTADLDKDLESIRGMVTAEARSLAGQNLDDSATDAAQLAQVKLKFEAAATRFKQLSTLLIPIGEQGITLDNTQTLIEEWRDALAARTATVARYLALRLGFLLGSVAIVLVISEVWRRATFRYLHDARRRQQFLALRRVAVGVALTVVIVFGLVSEVGSLATYAGLITAGIAVALQNVILAVVAYFFLIGRYGVRVGDRITLAGVTGRVVEIGLVRIYLMELTGPELRSSGRMVVLSNSVLFQPTALFKQMPGGDYFWHTISLTLAPTTDVQAAEKRLSEAANSIYENYRPAIEQQHAALQRFIDFETTMPRPEVYARLTDKGLECTVRYPVEPARAAIIDQKMLSALREAQRQAPELELVGGPLLTSSES